MAEILLVDDEPAIREAISFILEMEGFSVDLAEDGEQALEKVRRIKPKVVLLDVMMPKLDGYRVCESIKKDPETAATSVIMLTAMGQVADREKALAAGADAYITKPFDEDSLLALLHRLVKGEAGG